MQNFRKIGIEYLEMGPIFTYENHQKDLIPNAS